MVVKTTTEEERLRIMPRTSCEIGGSGPFLAYFVDELPTLRTFDLLARELEKGTSSWATSKSGDPGSSTGFSSSADELSVSVEKVGIEEFERR